MSDLLERLRKVESSTTQLTKLVTDAAGYPITIDKTEDTTNWLRNPDGPKAADEIERLRELLKELRIDSALRGRFSTHSQ